MPRKYLPDWLSSIVRERGVHFMCVLRKGYERLRAGADIKLTPEYADVWRHIADECEREGKLVPIRKFIQAFPK